MRCTTKTAARLIRYSGLNPGREGWSFAGAHPILVRAGNRALINTRPHPYQRNAMPGGSPLAKLLDHSKYYAREVPRQSGGGQPSGPYRLRHRVFALSNRRLRSGGADQARDDKYAVKNELIAGVFEKSTSRLFSVRLEI